MKKSKQYGESFSHTLRKLFRATKIEFAIITAMIYAMLMFSSCRNSEKNQEQVEQNHPQQKGEENDNYEHSGHSQQMNETRKWLRQELCKKYNQP